MKKVTIITGKIATGKTQIAIEKSIECIKQSKKVVHLTFEDRKENIQKWFVAKYVNKYPEELTKEDIENFRENILFLNLFLLHKGVEEIKNCELFYLVDLIASCDVIVVDFLQCMGYSKETYRSIIDFAVKYNKEVYIVISQNNDEFDIDDAENFDEIIDAETYYSKKQRMSKSVAVSDLLRIINTD